MGAPSLSLRQGAALTLTPALQRALTLLRMPAVELASYLDDELQNNPFLENQDAGDPNQGAGDHSQPQPVAPSVSIERTERTQTTSEPPWAQRRSSSAAPFADEQDAIAQIPAQADSLYSFLLKQIGEEFKQPQHRAIAQALTDLLDERGYLPSDLEAFAQSQKLKPQHLAAVIKRLHGFDPAGIYARSLAECFALQLKERGEYDETWGQIFTHWDDFSAQNWDRLQKTCALSWEDLRARLQTLSRLETRPAQCFHHATPPPSIIPDVLLHFEPDGRWLLELNNGLLPSLTVARSYARSLTRSRTSQDERRYIGEHLRSARWLTRTLEKRAQTILAVSAQIVRHQELFFIHGIQALQPLTLSQIAQAISMHESTVSRVVNEKYLATPRGAFALRWFFSAGLPSHKGHNLSAQAVQDKIKDLIAKENSAQILSDEALAQILKKDGITIARRTVTKYREAKNIPSSAQRRRLKKLHRKSEPVT